MPRRPPRKPDPSLDLSGHLLELAALPALLDPQSLFPRQAPIEMEVGSGKGLFCQGVAHMKRTCTIDGKVFSPTLGQAVKFLQRPYCATNHAFQGLSLGNKIYIHEYDHYMADHRWMRTAVSRCSTLDIVLVKHRRVRAPAQDVAQRIAGHRAADQRFAYDGADYVDAPWVAATLARQRGQCAECQGDLGEVATGMWSIDRVDNDQPHTKGNCRLVCHVRKGTCQQKSGGRRPAA